MARKQPTSLQEFVLDPARLFAGHGRKERAYHARYGVFDNIQADVESALDRGDIPLPTPGIWKIYVYVIDETQEPAFEDSSSEGVLQCWLRLSRARLDAAGSLLAQKHYVAGALTEYMSALGGRHGFDAKAIVERLRRCAQASELVAFALPSRGITSASGARQAQWGARMTFADTVIGARIVEAHTGSVSTVDLVRFGDAAYALVAMFVSTIRWTGERRLMFRTRPLTEVLFGSKRVSILLDSQDGVTFRRVPAHPRPSGEWQQSEFRFEWRLDLGNEALVRLLRPG